MAAVKNNKYALGNTGGRPPKYKSVIDIEKKISEFFNDNDKPTITGLTLYLGFESRQSLYDYKERQEFTYPIKRALTVIEHYYELCLRAQSCAGAIFALKNMNWHDKHEASINVNRVGLDAIEEAYE